VAGGVFVILLCGTNDSASGEITRVLYKGVLYGLVEIYLRQNWPMPWSRQADSHAAAIADKVDGRIAEARLQASRLVAGRSAAGSCYPAFVRGLGVEVSDTSVNAWKHALWKKEAPPAGRRAFFFAGRVR